MRPKAENNLPVGRSEAGFSLLELVIAVSVLVMMTGVLSPALVRYIEKGRERRDRQNIEMVYNAVSGALYDETAYDAFMSGQKKDGVYSAPIAVSTLFLQEDNFAEAVKDYVPTPPVLLSRKALGERQDAQIMLSIREEIDRSSGIRTMQVSVWAGDAESCSGSDFYIGAANRDLKLRETEPEENG